MSIDHNMMSYIKKVQGNPRLHVSVNLLFGGWPPSCATPPSSSLPPSCVCAMITTRKSIHGFPLVSYMGMGLHLAGAQLLLKVSLICRCAHFTNLHHINNNICIILLPVYYVKFKLPVNLFSWSVGRS